MAAKPQAHARQERKTLILNVTNLSVVSKLMMIWTLLGCNPSRLQTANQYRPLSVVSVGWFWAPQTGSIQTLGFVSSVGSVDLSVHDNCIRVNYCLDMTLAWLANSQLPVKVAVILILIRFKSKPTNKDCSGSKVSN